MSNTLMETSYGEATQKVLSLVRKQGLARPRDLARQGVSREMLRYLCGRGLVERAARGLYRLPGQLTEHQSLLEASRLVPKGVICLLSALRFHELGTQQPFEVWMAIPAKSWRPQVSMPRLRIVRFSGKAFSEGVEEHRLPGGTLRIYGPAKTVADAFKYRNKIGLDVAVEALRDCLKHRKAALDDIWHYGKICRVQEVMRPYLEALI
jgi:predicted transcriptional regulator of viral defense system